MDSEEGKLFIGGIAWDTTEEKLAEYFSQYGDVSEAVIMRDKITGRPRGFAFLVFSDPSVIDRVIQEKHTIDDRSVDVKRALSREEQQNSGRSGNYNAGRGSGGGGDFKTKKIFVGGLPSTITEDGFREYFENYGSVTDVVVMYDQNTQRPRGFGFITFDTEDSVDRVLQKTFHELNGKLVEVKRALPKEANPGGGGRGGSHQGYGASGGSMNSFDGRMDGNRYMQQQQASVGGFNPYSGYGAAAGYGYGVANNVVGYGGYGGYGMGGYGSAAATGFGGPAAAYGNPNAGYVRGPSASLQNAWASQNPGYGGNAGYGAGVGGQSASGLGRPSGYESKGYDYNNFGGGNDNYSGGYNGAGSRGNAQDGGEQQGSMGSYGEANGNSGYSNSAWGNESSQASGGYAGGYGGQTQQH